jgi:UDP-3-O-[3-hydroxymyristoyl] glucosamine N-acyltransferase
VRIGGGVGISDHLRVGDQAVIGAGSGVASNIEAGVFVSGYPAVPHHRAVEQYVYASRQKRLHEKVEDLATRLDAIEQTNKK